MAFEGYDDHAGTLTLGGDSTRSGNCVSMMMSEEFLCCPRPRAKSLMCKR